MQDLEERVRQMETLLTASGVNVASHLTPPESTSEPTPLDIVEPITATEQDVPEFEFPTIDQHEHLWMDNQAYEGLPQPQEAALLLQEYLEDWNKAIPLFDRAALSQTFQDCYLGRVGQCTTDWAVVAVVLALAHKLRGMSPVATGADSKCADRHKERLLQMVPSLAMQEPSLQVVQCLVGIGILLYLDVDNNRAHLFVTMALRMMEPLEVGGCKSVNLVDQWRSVFWVAFTLDADLALRWGRMPSRRSEEVAKYAPPTTSEQGRIYSADGDWNIDYLSLRAELSLIQARVSEKLLPSGSADAASDLLQELKTWRCHWIFHQAPRELSQHLHRSDVVTLAILEAAYHHTIFSIRTHVTLLSKRAAHIYDGDTLLRICKEKAQPCLQDSRRFFEFMRLLPRGEISWVYAVSHAMVSSVIVLLANATTNTSDPRLSTDMDIVRSILELMSRISANCRHPDCRQVQNVCQQLYERTGHSRKGEISHESTTSTRI